MSHDALTAWIGPPPPADPYAANPFVAELERADQSGYMKAIAYAGPAPKLFDGGARDVPDKTACGVDGYWLSWLPAGVRHHAAALPTEAEFFALVERVAGDPDARIDHPDLAAAERRLRAWMTSEQTDAAAAATTARAKASVAAATAAATFTPKASAQPAEPARQPTPMRVFNGGAGIDAVLLMSKRGEFLPPRSTMRRSTPALRADRPHRLMPDYSPKFKPGQDITLTASAAIVAGQLVAVSGVNTVAPTDGFGPVWTGVARQDAAAGELVVVSRGGVQHIVSAGDVAAAARVAGAADGRVTVGTTNAVGTALTDAVDGAPVLVLMDR